MKAITQSLTFEQKLQVFILAIISIVALVNYIV
jgi:hypothetical protein